jgi:type IV pilus assembly protein PilA
VLAIVSLVLAGKAKREIASSYGARSGLGVVKAARILAVVCFIWGILALLAVVPAFLGARDRARDRAAQSDVRIALIAAKTRYTDSGQWPTADQLPAIEPGLAYAASDGEVSKGTIEIENVNEGVIGLATKSASGACFYVASAADGSTGFAKSNACTAPSAQKYFNRWP